MRILVTGGAGYIGCHTVKLLLEKGYEPIIFDNLSTGHAELLPGGILIQADLREKFKIEETIRQYKIEAVIHFAALIQVGESYENPKLYYSHNLITTLNLLEAMLEAGVNKFVFSSSAAVYGQPQFIPITEDHPLNPVNPYGRTKAFIEKIIEDLGRAHNLNYVSLRYFNAAGADLDGRRGELHNPETHLIPNLMLHLLNKRPYFELYGHDFPTPDGTAIRDYIHVLDLAEAHVLALELLGKEKIHEVFNLGTGQGYSVKEIISLVEQITGKKVNLVIKPKRQGDVPILMASKEKAIKKLHWQPRYSDIETIIKSAWNWHLYQVGQSYK
ncbi:MAG: UDP-glucose 4-epimerase GalE [Candidatus Aminicenantes bacterium]|nr:UDP-glucose 4-epimerase GalE [Candidatus Aminicenantes bacterium]